MSMDINIKATSTPVVVPSVSSVAVAVNDAVKTELRAPQSVTAVDAPAYARNETRSGPDGGVSRQVLKDDAAATFVYQTVDKDTDEVISQFPDDAALRRRAYYEALDRQKDAPHTQPQPTDRKI